MCTAVAFMCLLVVCDGSRYYLLGEYREDRPSRLVLPPELALPK